MDALTILDKILSSRYPWLALAFYVTFYIIKGIKANWKGFTGFIKESVNRHFTAKEQQIEVQIELDLQIKALVTTQNALQEQLKILIGQNQSLKEFLGELAHKLEYLSEGFWENRRHLDAYFKKTDAIWAQVGILPEQT